MLTFSETVLAGIVGTGLMSLLMTVIHRSGWANADMIRALGGIVTRSYEQALGPGLLLHFVTGAFFAFPYAFVITGLGFDTVAADASLGGLIGFVHGFVMSFLLVAAVAERHPVQQFREAGFEVAAAHVLGHVAYGVGVGATIGIFHVSFGFRF